MELILSLLCIPIPPRPQTLPEGLSNTHREQGKGHNIAAKLEPDEIDRVETTGSRVLFCRVFESRNRIHFR